MGDHSYQYDLASDVKSSTVSTAPRSVGSRGAVTAHGMRSVMPETPRLSQLSPARQALVRICQAVNFGQIRDIRLQDGDPVLDSACVLADERLDRPAEPRPEIGLSDFALCEEWCRLLGRLDQIRDGTIEGIEVRAGIPRRMIFEWPVAAATAEREGGLHGSP